MRSISADESALGNGREPASHAMRQQ
jgi:hypothetical protein